MTRRKRISSLALLSSMTLGLCSCSNKDTLLFLNWGEYIDEEMLDAFEEKYNCSVSMDLGESNEIFYSKVRGGTTVYDVVCPSDYMVEKMYENDLLHEIDFDKLTMSGYNPIQNKDNIRTGVLKIFDDMDKNLASTNSNYQSGEIIKYAVPYLWGTWGIMYSTKVSGLEEAVQTNQNQWACLFDRTSIPSGTRVAMYDSHQHAYYAASRYFEASTPLDNSYGIELSQADLMKMQHLIENMKYDAWGTDNIKKDIVANNIDVGFMWTGDFLYYYAENAADKAIEYFENEENVDADVLNAVVDVLCGVASKEECALVGVDFDKQKTIVGKSGSTYEIGFDCFIPDNTVAFCDNLCITKNASHLDLAYKFIDFMSSYKTSKALDDNGKEINPDTLDEESIYTPHFANTYYVDYDATTYDIYDDLVALKDNPIDSLAIDAYSNELKSGLSSGDTSLYSAFYDKAIGIGFDKYYPRETTKGQILAKFPRKYINQINATFNNARA